MAKSTTTDIIAILRLFALANDETTKKSITHVKEYPERTLSRLITFVYDKTRYYIFFDQNANDDDLYIFEQIRLDAPEAKGQVVRNPQDGRKTYGMPYKGKDVYLVEVLTGKFRLDVELARRYPELSRSTIQKYIKNGDVTVDGEVVLQTKTDVSENNVLALNLPADNDFKGQALPIVYIDDNVIVVNKPAGVLTHAKGALNHEFTVAEFFRRYTTHALHTNRPGIVHRLDRDTSGIMIGARNDETAVLLKKQFADRKTKKQYVAIVDGVPKVEHAVIDLPIGRNPSAPSTFRVDPSGKPALTTYEVLASNGKQSLVKLLPKTGRTHQLRVHLQYINTPISGDRVYGRPNKDGRLYLHAYRLELTIPSSERKLFTAEVPEEFTHHFPGVKYD